MVNYRQTNKRKCEPMGTLKYAILGLLNQKDMTGYELMKEFESTLSEFWYAKHSQIYPELHDLNKKGLITYQIEIAGTSLEKKLYAITATGKEDFLSWLSSETTMEPTPKDVSRLKIFFSDCLSQKERIALMEDQLAQHTARMEHLKNNQKKFTKIPARDSGEFGDYLVLMGAIMREENHCAWLQKCLTLTKKSK